MYLVNLVGLFTSCIQILSRPLFYVSTTTSASLTDTSGRLHNDRSRSFDYNDDDSGIPMTIFQVEACDGESARLRCPRGTVIGLQSAVYGRDGSSSATSTPVCPSAVQSSTFADYDSAMGLPMTEGFSTSDSSALERRIRRARRNSRVGSHREPVHTASAIVRRARHTERDVGPGREPAGRCFAVDTLEVIWPTCENKTQCSVRASSRQFDDGLDPPGCLSATSAKIVNRLVIHYHCRPSEFRRRTACPGQTVSLSCPRQERIYVESAEFVPIVGGPCPSSSSHSDLARKTAATDDCARVDSSMSARRPHSSHNVGDNGPRGPEMTSQRRKSHINDRCQLAKAVRRCHGRNTCMWVADDDVARVCAGSSSRDRQPSSSTSSTQTALRIVYACVTASVIRPRPSPTSTDLVAVCGAGSSDVIADGDAMDEQPGEDDTGDSRMLPPSSVGIGSSNPSNSQNQDISRWRQRGSENSANQDISHTTGNNSFVIERRSVLVATTIWTATGDASDSTGSKPQVVSYDWIWAWNFTKSNGELCILYASLGAALGAIVVLFIVTGRLWQLHLARQRIVRSQQLSSFYQRQPSDSAPETTLCMTSTIDDFPIPPPPLSSGSGSRTGATMTSMTTVSCDLLFERRRTASDLDLSETNSRRTENCRSLLLSPASRPITSSRPILHFDEDD